MALRSRICFVVTLFLSVATPIAARKYYTGGGDSVPIISFLNGGGSPATAVTLAAAAAWRRSHTPNAPLVALQHNTRLFSGFSVAIGGATAAATFMENYGARHLNFTVSGFINGFQVPIAVVAAQFLQPAHRPTAIMWSGIVIISGAGLPLVAHMTGNQQNVTTEAILCSCGGAILSAVIMPVLAYGCELMDVQKELVYVLAMEFVTVASTISAAIAFFVLLGTGDYRLFKVEAKKFVKGKQAYILIVTSLPLMTQILFGCIIWILMTDGPALVAAATGLSLPITMLMNHFIFGDVFNYVEGIYMGLQLIGTFIFCFGQWWSTQKAGENSTQH